MKIGITGNIASGKTTVEAILKELKAPVIDADTLVHRLIKQEKVKNRILKAFPREDILNDCQELDRPKIGKIVFKNPHKLKQLTDILHPLVRQEIDNFIHQYQDAPVVFASIPLLFETPYYTHGYFDAIWLIYVDEEVQIQRLMTRNGITKEEALERIALQIPQNQKKDLSDLVIQNSGDLRHLQEKVHEEYYKLLNRQVT